MPEGIRSAREPAHTYRHAHERSARHVFGKLRPQVRQRPSALPAALGKVRSGSGVEKRRRPIGETRRLPETAERARRRVMPEEDVRRWWWWWGRWGRWGLRHSWRPRDTGGGIHRAAKWGEAYRVRLGLGGGRRGDDRRGSLLTVTTPTTPTTPMF